ncbi:DUF4132 domain-containing protein [Dactylosporangium sp. NBC_01737]|uniref:DUF4132 domain-containing protein n=1 Tax=Dactylosporangium sp. NBC_01737 TaxID=2975959 RepID=UPI002E156DE0|nr:DUF4132 domain-containing protein [Dactylosporangium sp. NBC_01737]
MRLSLRLRAHLAAAGDDEHRAVVADLAALRDDPRPLRRLTASLLAPTETAWVDEDCATFAAAGDETLCRLLLPAAGTHGQLEVLLRAVEPHWLFWDEPTILTLAAAAGPDLEPLLLHLLRTASLSADAVTWTARILAVFPTDSAFDALTERSGWRQVQPALAAAVRRFPERALRRLAEGPAHQTVAVLLAAHVRADPARATRLLPDLSEPAAARVRALLDVDAGPVAAAAALPEVLASPPWTVRRPAAPVVAGLVCPDPPAFPGRGAGSWVAADAEALLDRTGPDVAAWMAGWLARSEQARPVAREWLRRHPAAAATALVPAALARPGAPRRDAEHALRHIVRSGHTDTVLAAAERHGPAALDGIRALLDTDPLHVLPARIPATPGWADAALLPRVQLRDGTALPAGAARHLVTILAMSTLEEPYAGVASVREACDPASLAGFGWALFESWQAAGRPSAQRWAFTALGLIGDDTTATRLGPLLRDWPAAGEHTNARHGADVLAAIGTPAALRHLHRLAVQATGRLKDHAARRAADAAAAAAAGLSAEELADRLVPDLGLAADATLTLDYGPRRFTAGFDEHLRPYVLDHTGHRRRTLPNPTASDDPALAPSASAHFAALRKEARTIAIEQTRRLETAMTTQSRWSGAAFRHGVLPHPLLWQIARHLVWATFDAPGPHATLVTAFRLAEDRTLAGVTDEPVTLPDDAVVGVAHPIHLAATVPLWTQLFADYEILQPFPQLARDVHHPPRPPAAAPPEPDTVTPPRSGAAGPGAGGPGAGGPDGLGAGAAGGMGAGVPVGLAAGGMGAGGPDGLGAGAAGGMGAGVPVGPGAGVLGAGAVGGVGAGGPGAGSARGLGAGAAGGRGVDAAGGLGAGVVGRTTDGRRLFLLDRRGWVRATPEDGGRICAVSRPVPGGGRIVVELDPGVFAGWPDGAGAQTVTAVRVEPDPGRRPPPPAAVHPSGQPGPAHAAVHPSGQPGPAHAAVHPSGQPGPAHAAARTPGQPGPAHSAAPASGRPGPGQHGPGTVVVDPVTFSETVRDLLALVE